MSTPAAPQPPIAGRNPIPIQTQQFTKEQLTDPAVMNNWYQQLIDAVNTANGTLGKVVQPSGFDVQGATVSNLGPPQEDGDAISSGHAASQYGSAAQQKALDVGGPDALKGLNVAYAQSAQNAQVIKALQAALPAYVGGSGSIQVGGIILKFGHTGVIATTLAVTFAAAFPTACLAVIVSDDLAGGTGLIMSVDGAPTVTGFTVHSSGTTNGAWWFALGN